MLQSLIYVGIGGFVGSVARYGLHLIVGSRWPSAFPWGTFTVNVVGCLLIGLLIGFSFKEGILNDTLKLLLITGFCGGFTTFSTFSLDGLNLLQSGAIWYFLGYTIGSVVLGLAATFIGYQLVS